MNIKSVEDVIIDLSKNLSKVSHLLNENELSLLVNKIAKFVYREKIAADVMSNITMLEYLKGQFTNNFFDHYLKNISSSLEDTFNKYTKNVEKLVDRKTTGDVSLEDKKKYIFLTTGEFIDTSSIKNIEDPEKRDSIAEEISNKYNEVLNQDIPKWEEFISTFSDGSGNYDIEKLNRLNDIINESLTYSPEEAQTEAERLLPVVEKEKGRLAFKLEVYDEALQTAKLSLAEFESRQKRFKTDENQYEDRNTESPLAELKAFIDKLEGNQELYNNIPDTYFTTPDIPEDAGILSNLYTASASFNFGMDIDDEDTKKEEVEESEEEIKDTEQLEQPEEEKNEDSVTSEDEISKEQPQEEQIEQSTNDSEAEEIDIEDIPEEETKLTKEGAYSLIVKAIYKIAAEEENNSPTNVIREPGKHIYLDEEPGDYSEPHRKHYDKAKALNMSKGDKVGLFNLLDDAYTYLNIDTTGSFVNVTVDNLKELIIQYEKDIRKIKENLNYYESINLELLKYDSSTRADLLGRLVQNETSVNHIGFLPGRIKTYDDNGVAIPYPEELERLQKSRDTSLSNIRQSITTRDIENTEMIAVSSNVSEDFKGLLETVNNSIDRSVLVEDEEGNENKEINQENISQRAFTIEHLMSDGAKSHILNNFNYVIGPEIKNKLTAKDTAQKYKNIPEVSAIPEEAHNIAVTLDKLVRGTAIPDDNNSRAVKYIRNLMYRLTNNPLNMNTYDKLLNESAIPAVINIIDSLDIPNKESLGSALGNMINKLEEAKTVIDSSGGVDSIPVESSEELSNVDSFIQKYVENDERGNWLFNFIDVLEKSELFNGLIDKEGEIPEEEIQMSPSSTINDLYMLAKQYKRSILYNINRMSDKTQELANSFFDMDDKITDVLKKQLSTHGILGPEHVTKINFFYGTTNTLADLKDMIKNDMDSRAAYLENKGVDVEKAFKGWLKQETERRDKVYNWDSQFEYWKTHITDEISTYIEHDQKKLNEYGKAKEILSNRIKEIQQEVTEEVDKEIDQIQKSDNTFLSTDLVQAKRSTIKEKLFQNKEYGELLNRYTKVANEFTPISQEIKKLEQERGDLLTKIPKMKKREWIKRVSKEKPTIWEFFNYIGENTNLFSGISDDKQNIYNRVENGEISSEEAEKLLSKKKDEVSLSGYSPEKIDKLVEEGKITQEEAIKRKDYFEQLQNEYKNRSEEDQAELQYRRNKKTKNPFMARYLDENYSMPTHELGDLSHKKPVERVEVSKKQSFYKTFGKSLQGIAEALNTFKQDPTGTIQLPNDFLDRINDGSIEQDAVKKDFSDRKTQEAQNFLDNTLAPGIRELKKIYKAMRSSFKEQNLDNTDIDKIPKIADFYKEIKTLIDTYQKIKEDPTSVSNNQLQYLTTKVHQMLNA